MYKVYRVYLMQPGEHHHDGNEAQEGAADPYWGSVRARSIGGL